MTSFNIYDTTDDKFGMPKTFTVLMTMPDQFNKTLMHISKFVNNYITKTPEVDEPNKTENNKRIIYLLNQITNYANEPVMLDYILQIDDCLSELCNILIDRLFMNFDGEWDILEIIIADVCYLIE